MILDNAVDRWISKRVLEARAARDSEHKASGKLSASMLGWPAQWQILKVLGVPPRPFDEYTLRKFLRGEQVEDWLLSELPDKISTQQFVEYRDCIGYVDAVVDTKAWEWPEGTMPVEIKSVSNAKFRRILSRGADRSHRLQACFYAMALRCERYCVMYVSTDDLRVQTYVYKTKDDAQTVENVIDRFEALMRSETIPPFAPEEDWQANPEYQMYSEWANLKPDEIIEKAKLLNLTFAHLTKEEI